MRGPLLCLFVGLLLSWPGATRAQAKKQRMGGLDVKVSVEGAEIAVDGAPVARSPLEAPIQLTAGNHSLKVSKPGHSEYLDVVRIRPGATTTVEVVLIPFAAAVRITSTPPGAGVYIDGQPAGRTPHEAELEPGARRLRVVHEGFHDATREVELLAGETYSFDFALVPLPRPPPAAPVDRPFYRKWPFWAAAGAAVVLGTITVVVVTSGGDPRDDADRVITPTFP